MTACENLIGSPRFSPRNISVPFLTWVLSAPSPPMCTCTTTRSACSLAFFTSAWAASMSTTLCDQAYEAKPSTATRTPLTSTTVIWPGAPVCARPALSSACLVCRLPSAPKSYAWLFARFIRRNPASRSSVAYAGGERNAKQVFPADSAEHLPTPVSFVSGCSRLPICRSARRASRTGVKRSLPLLGGRAPGAEPMMMSPVADIVIVWSAPAPAGAEADGPTGGDASVAVAATLPAARPVPPRGDPGGAGPGRPVRIGCGPGGVGTRRLGGAGAILVVRLPGRRSGRGGTVDRQLRAIPLKTVGREADRTGATIPERHRTGRPYLSRPASLSPRPGENGAATPTRPRVPPHAPPAPTWHPHGSAAR